MLLRYLSHWLSVEIRGFSQKWMLTLCQRVWAFVAIKGSFQTEQMKATEKPDIWKKNPNTNLFLIYRKNWAGVSWHDFFQIFIDVTVWDFFVPENSNCCEKAFVYGFFTYHILSDYILVIINLLDVTSSVLYCNWSTRWSNSQQDLY